MQVSNYNEIIKKYENSSPEIKYYFQYLPDLVKNYPLQVALLYSFSLIEQAQNMTLYIGLTKLHKTEKSATWKAISDQILSQERFGILFKEIFGKNISKDINEKLFTSKKIRNKTIHGKYPTQKEIREVLITILEFAELFNKFLYSIARFKPFGKYKGFKGRAKSINKEITERLLTSFGFTKNIKLQN